MHYRKLPIPELDVISTKGDVEKVCEQIAKGYRDRVIGGPLYTDSRSSRSPNAWLREIAYLTINIALCDDWYDDLEERIEWYDRRLRGVEGEPNIFQTGLLGIFAHDPDSLSSAQRVRLGRQLWYAYRHFVPIPFLEAFLKDAGTRKVMELAPQDVIDDRYVDWIVAHVGNTHSYSSADTTEFYSNELLALVGYRRAEWPDLRDDGVDEADWE